MLKETLIGTALILSSLATTAQTTGNIDKSMPPISILPKNGEAKHIIKLDHSGAYVYYDNKGKLLGKGEGEWLDVTNVSSPVIFVKQDGHTAKYLVHKEEKEK